MPSLPLATHLGQMAQTLRSFTWHQTSICLGKVAEVGLVLLLLLRATRVPDALPSPSGTRISSPTLLSWASTCETKGEADPVTTAGGRLNHSQPFVTFPRPLSLWEALCFRGSQDH